MKAVMGKQPWLKDPLVMRKRWSEEEYGLIDHGREDSAGERKLCFGIVWDDEIIAPHPPIQRGLEMVKEALLAKGHRGKYPFLPSFLGLGSQDTHTVVDWKAHKHDEIYDVAVGPFNASIFLSE
jgi:amidase